MQGSKWIVACLLTVVSLIQGAAAQTADQHVTFDTAPYVLGQIQRRLALERGEMVVATGQTIDGYLSKPE
ncbi:MAG: dienelactone hydrolase family protein, partial [Bradyrhizobium sp.]|nr:dienelactone hydrolase family protein [Bradyrhizobium sp.]